MSKPYQLRCSSPHPGAAGRELPLQISHLKICCIDQPGGTPDQAPGYQQDPNPDFMPALQLTTPHWYAERRALPK
ncbi:hypothetical protein [Hymenobacter persicinus]|uniref:Uncharacterized protein n=1 Tax=Hymenobacter persicinus TaxID=2025506 RepID=A0A4Q5LF13_9BACT|nr:hypothetical protein [Hymenobacter persicinus]RYU81074.1 hypothetical protein EWM57_07485 [Hymenobacter persicinus]